MTLLKRLVTAFFLFFPLFVAFYIGICAVGGGIAGGRAAMAHPEIADKRELGRDAGRNFVKNNFAGIVLGSFGASFIIALAVPFTGILPWCRKPTAPPNLPLSVQ